MKVNPTPNTYSKLITCSTLLTEIFLDGDAGAQLNPDKKGNPIRPV
ncbi:hypothetical protein AAXB25_16550 [Paenibacillus lautus]